MSTLDEAVRRATEKGLSHLTLYPVQSEDGKKTYWAARATPSTMHKYVQTQSLDPVDALMQVLDALPKASKRPKVTATVTQNEPAPALEVRAEEPQSEFEKSLPRA